MLSLSAFYHGSIDRPGLTAAGQIPQMVPKHQREETVWSNPEKKFSLSELPPIHWRKTLYVTISKLSKGKNSIYFALRGIVQKKETVVNISLPEILCQEALVQGQRSLSLDDFTHTVEVAFIIPAQNNNWLGTSRVVEP